MTIPNTRHVASQIVCMSVHDDDEDWVREKWKTEIDAAEILIRGLLEARSPSGSAGSPLWQPVDSIPERRGVLVRGGYALTGTALTVAVAWIEARTCLYRPDGTLRPESPREWHPLPDDDDNLAKIYAKLDGDSLDAIMEVIGEGPEFRHHNEGKTRMRHWFLGRLRRLWNLPEPQSPEAGR